MRPAILSILPHTHAFRCNRPELTSVYLASHPTVTGTVNTDRISYLDCDLRTARLNDDCLPHPTTVAAAPHFPHTRPPDVPARLVYQRLLVNTYRTSDLCRPPGRTRPPSDPASGALLPSPAVVPVSTFLVLDAAAATCLTVRMTFWLLVVLSAVARAALPTVMTTVIAPGANLTFNLTMPHLNAATPP
jgi:hypothetical protein